MKRNVNQLPEVQVELPIPGNRGFLTATAYNMCLTITRDVAGTLLISRAAAYGDASSRRSVDGLKEMETIIIRDITVFGTTFQNVPAQVSGLNTVGMGLLRFFDLDLDVDGEVIYTQLLQPERSRTLGMASAPFHFRFASPSKVIVDPFGIKTHRLDKEIKAGDELIECEGQVASRLSYWQLKDLLSSSERAVKCRFRNEKGIFEVLARPDSEAAESGGGPVRSLSSESDAFLEFLRQ